MTHWTKTRVFVGIVSAIVATVTHFPAQYAAVVRLAAKQPIGAGARFCYNKYLIVIFIF